MTPPKKTAADSTGLSWRFSTNGVGCNWWKQARINSPLQSLPFFQIPSPEPCVSEFGLHFLDENSSVCKCDLTDLNHQDMDLDAGARALPQRRDGNLGPRKWSWGKWRLMKNIEMDASKIPRLVATNFGGSELNHP